MFFAHTVKVQNDVLEDETTADNIVEVTGQQWSWTFNYGIGDLDNAADDDRFDDDFAYDSYVYDGGTGSYIPELWLPVDETTRFNLHSPDVIHDFGVPGFLMKMDVIPGRVNHYVITPTRERRLQRASATSSAASTTPGCSSTSRSSAARSTTRTSQDLEDAGQTATCRCSAARRPTPRPASRIRGRSPSDRHRVPPQHRRRPRASRWASRSSGS